MLKQFLISFLFYLVDITINTKPKLKPSTYKEDKTGRLVRNLSVEFDSLDTTMSANVREEIEKEMLTEIANQQNHILDWMASTNNKLKQCDQKMQRINAELVSISKDRKNKVVDDEKGDTNFSVQQLLKPESSKETTQKSSKTKDDSSTIKEIKKIHAMIKICWNKP